MFLEFVSFFSCHVCGKGLILELAFYQGGRLFEKSSMRIIETKGMVIAVWVLC